MTESVCQHKARKLQQVYSALKNTAPKTREHLKSYLKVFLNINVPDVTVCDGHTNPMDYLWHSYASDFTTNDNPNADCIVWANRGGGKTQLAAIATLLDCLFKPGCKVRILGGSG
jgi:broad specificity polyphosphatase/5'/3'-nucleotidase SurE